LAEETKALTWGKNFLHFPQFLRPNSENQTSIIFYERNFCETQKESQISPHFQNLFLGSRGKESHDENFEEPFLRNKTLFFLFPHFSKVFFISLRKKSEWRSDIFWRETKISEFFFKFNFLKVLNSSSQIIKLQIFWKKFFVQKLIITACSSRHLFFMFWGYINAQHSSADENSFLDIWLRWKKMRWYLYRFINFYKREKPSKWMRTFCDSGLSIVHKAFRHGEHLAQIVGNPFHYKGKKILKKVSKMFSSEVERIFENAWKYRKVSKHSPPVCRKIKFPIDNTAAIEKNPTLWKKIFPRINFFFFKNLCKRFRIKPKCQLKMEFSLSLYFFQKVVFMKT